jgi:YHS domain-containing protein
LSRAEDGVSFCAMNSIRACVICGALLVAACGGAAAHSEAPATASAGDQALVEPGAAKIGDRTTCAQSGEEFVVSESSASAEHGGKTYYFCCPGCAKRFQADPEKALSKLRD